MRFVSQTHRPLFALSLALGVAALAACSSSTASTTSEVAPAVGAGAQAPSPDPRVGLKAGRTDAGEALWNLKLLSKTAPPPGFANMINSDLAFLGNYVIQGSFNGYQVWDISNPGQPSIRKAYVCPASQSDVSVYRNLLFVSGEDLGARIDCGTTPVRDTVSKDRLRGLRIFDISDIDNPRNVGNVQTCRGSHTHSVLVDPKDAEHVYIYISGSAPPRSPSELAGCIRTPMDPNTALFRIEVIKVPLANPAQAAIVSSPRIFANLATPPTHGEAPEDVAAQKREVDAARARGAFIFKAPWGESVLPNQMARQFLDSIVQARGGTGAPTGADSATLRGALQGIVDKLIGVGGDEGGPTGPTQCHDITVYPAIGLAGGACEGYGFLLDISDPVNPKRIGEVADSNFSYWHSATFNNDGSKILFSDEWGGGGGPKCRVTDKPEWGADAIFTIENRKMVFRSYYKLPAAQTPQENCVAHNGSLIPIPDRDIMVQAWYQGGISVFEWTDAARPKEIAFFDRGPFDSTRLVMAGSWSVYWYNGVIVSSEIQRGLDILELVPSAFITQNEIEAAKTVKFDYLNVQGQQQLVWPPSFALARAYVDQLDRGRALSVGRLAAIRKALATAETQSGAVRRDGLTQLARDLEAEAAQSGNAAKVRKLAGVATELAGR